MGVDTYFEGSFKLDRPLEPAQRAYLQRFSQTRRMKRDVGKLQDVADPTREAAGLPLGPEGAYFVGGGLHGYDHPSVINGNEPPQDQPGLWCKWVSSEDGQEIIWSGAEKFYWFVEWLEYLIEHFLVPWGYVLNGEAKWEGKPDDWSVEKEDLITCIEWGTIRVQDNVVEVTKVSREPIPEDYYDIWRRYHS